MTDIYFNKENRDRTIKKLKDYGISFKRKKKHECEFNKCRPFNIKRFMNKNEIAIFNYDEDVWICMYQKIHICDGYCMGKERDNLVYCTKTGVEKPRYISYVPVFNKQNPQQQNSVMPQHPNVIKNHASTKKAFNHNYKVDKLYNHDYRFYVDKDDESKKESVTPRAVRNRNKQLQQFKYADNLRFIDCLNDEELISILKMEAPISKVRDINMYLHSFQIVNYMKNVNRNIVDLSMNPHKFSNMIIKDSFKKINDIGIIIEAEDVLSKILPGIFRIRNLFDTIMSAQSKLYLETKTYLDECCFDDKKKIANSFRIVCDKLNFDKYWKDNNCILHDWVTPEKWVYYLTIIFNMFMYCKVFGFFEKKKRKCINPKMHVLGVIYLLKSGYTFNNEVVIPRDIYLNKHGVLFEKKYLSNCFGKRARSFQKTGLDSIKEYLDVGCRLMPAIDLRNLLFS